MGLRQLGPVRQHLGHRVALPREYMAGYLLERPWAESEEAVATGFGTLGGAPLTQSRSAIAVGEDLRARAPDVGRIANRSA